MLFHSPSLVLLVLFLSFASTISALTDPATLFVPQENPHRVGFVIPPDASPPYGKSLRPSSYTGPSLRNWEWTHWLGDAKSMFKSLFRTRVDKSRSGFVDQDDRNVGRFDNDVVLRVNVTCLSDRKTIT